MKLRDQIFRIFKRLLKTASDHFSYLLKLMFNLLIHLNQLNHSIYCLNKRCDQNLFKISPFLNHILATLQTVQIQISQLLKKLADQDLHCFRRAD